VAAPEKQRRTSFWDGQEVLASSPSKHRAVHHTPLTVVQMSYIPCPQQPTHSKVRNEPPYGPQTAVSSIPCLASIKSCQNDKVCCSVKDNVSTQQTGPVALSPNLQVANTPVIQDTMHLKVQGEPSYSIQTTVFPVTPRFCEESTRHCPEGTE
jgi:hypothetical protein